MTTIFQNKSQQVARGLNTIATRVAKSSDDLANYGVAVKDANGELRSTYDILVDLKPAWDKMSSAEKVALGNTLAGVNQYKVFAAVMNQMDTAVEAYNDALNSSGSTMAQNEIYMQSLEAKTTALKAEFENLVLGKGGLQDFAKKIVETGTGVLKLINKLGGLPSILITITSALIGINALKIGTMIVNTLTGLDNLLYALPNAVTAWRSYAAGVTSANTAMQASAGLIGIIATVIGVAISAVVAYNRKLEEQRQAIRDNITAFIDEYNTLDDVSQRLKDENISREELNSIIDANCDEYEAERLKLLNVNDARQQTLDLIEEEKKARAQEVVDTGLTEYEEALKEIQNGYKEIHEYAYQLSTLDLESAYNREIFDAFQKSGLASAKTVDAQREALVKYKNELLNLREKWKDSEARQREFSSEIKVVEGLLTNSATKYKEHIAIIDNFSKSLKTLGLHYVEETGKIEEGAEAWGTTLRVQEEALRKANQQTQYSAEELKELQKQYNITESAIVDMIEQIQAEEGAESDIINIREEAIIRLAQEAQEGKKAVETYDELSKSLSQLESSISSVATALTEQSNNGSIALKTQLELIDAGYAGALAYDTETGACKLDEEAVQRLAEAKINEKIASLEAARANLVDTLVAEANAAITASSAFIELARAKNVANEASLSQTSGRAGNDPSKSYAGWGGNGGYLQKSETRDKYDAIDTELKALEGSLKQIQRVGVKAFGTIGKSAEKAAKSAGSGAKSTKDATKATIDATKEAEKAAKKAEEEKKKAIEEATQAIQEQINALDEEIAKIEKQTEAIQKQKQELENIQSQYEKVFSFITKQIDKRIQEIEKEKDEAVNASKAIVDAKKAEIEALEEEYELAIKAKEEEKDLALEQIENEITLLKENKEKREQYWDKEIDALKQKNKELKDSLELQEKLDALEKAKNTKVKVYKAGQGFVYDVDQTEVQKAQKELDEYLTEKEYEEELERLENLKKFEIDNYDDRIDELTKFKDQTQKSYEEQIANLKKNIEQIKAQYDQEIANLEANTKALEAEYDAQIAIYEGYKEEFTNMVNKYDEEQEKLLASQLTGINFENDNWMTRIDNLQNFVDEYTSRIHEIERLNEEEAELNAEKAKLAEEREALQRRLNEAKNGESSSSSSSSNDIDIASPNYSSLVNGGNNSNSNDIGYSGGSGYSYGGSNYTPTTDSTLNISSSQTSQGQGVIGSRDLSQSTFDENALNAARRRASAASQGIKNVESALEAARKRAGYASGIGKIKDDEIAVVGENPYQEIVLGSKVNNGQLMSLSAGSGVVNAESTTTLAGLLNMMGKFGASQFGQGRGTLNNNTNNDTLIINGVTIEGANIKDPQTFVNGLLSLKSEALQRAYKAH